jgi:hypothetical protein
MVNIRTCATGLGLCSLLLSAAALAQTESSEKPAEKPADKPAQPSSDSGDMEPAPAEDVNVTQEARISRQGLGLDPGALSFGGLVLPPPPGAQVDISDRKANQLNYHGFLRGPFRVGIGSGDDVEPGVPTGPKLHNPPRVPDDAYTDWSYTGDRGGPWTEMQFSYGNARVFGTVALAAYNHTDAGFKDLVAQLGINQSWVTINLPDLFNDRGGLLINVGSFAGGYGSAGRYDAGAYGTYMFGRTHATGETVSAFYDITDDVTLQAEHGIGARLDVTPVTPGFEPPPYLPYSPEQQFPTFLHHAHLGATYLEKVRVAAHYLTQWTQAATTLMMPDGRISSYGLELKFIDTMLGNAFLGVSQIKSKEPLRVAGAFEVLHSWEGWSLRDNFFPNSRGNGTVTSVGGEWTFSLATFLRHPEPFWGQGPDLVARVFSIYSAVKSDEAGVPNNDKFKFGGSLTYTPLSWIGLSGRYDMVQPNMNDSRESFQVISPRILLRTEFVSHEEIVIQYDRYILGSGTRLSYYPLEAIFNKPDKNVFTIAATMWW